MRRKFCKSNVRRTRSSRRWSLEQLEPRIVLDGQLAITELMAFNGTTLSDEDGDFPDWIEIQNTGTASINLDGYFLTDNAADLTKWQFPGTALDAGDFFTLFASGKDRAVSGSELHTNFSLSDKGEFLALVNPDQTTIESQFFPKFPKQVLDVSFGTVPAATTTTFVEAGSPATVLIAADDSLGQSWTLPGFLPDNTWTAGTAAVGFGTPKDPLATPAGPRDATFFAPFGPGGTYNLYQVTSRPRTWDAARLYAAAQLDPVSGGVNGHLVTLASAEENEFVRSITGGDFWIGLTDNESFGGSEAGTDPQGGWAWLDGDPLTFENFAAGQPDDAAAGEDAVQILADGSWADRPLGALGQDNVSLRAVIEYDLQLPFVPDAYASGRFRVREVAGNGPILDIDEAITALNTGVGITTESFVPVVDFADPEAPGPGIFGGAQTFATNTPSDNDDFVFQATASLVIPQAGTWTFGVRSDAGFRLTIDGATFIGVTGNGTTIRDDTMEFATLRGTSNSLGIVQVPAAGIYDVELTYFAHSGDAVAEFFAAPGVKTQADGDFRLVGDTAGGGLALSGLGSSLGTDVQAMMQGANASALIRFPFAVDDASRFDQLTLRIKYDDGFVAYLNGVEVARRNAPGSTGTPLLFNAAATAEHPLSQANLSEQIDLTAHVGLLTDGDNVLAIQGLNQSAGDDEFFILPELVGGNPESLDFRYFVAPTPGTANGPGLVGLVKDTTFSVDRGFFNSPFLLEISSTTPGAEIRFTTDGSEPTATTGDVYSGPLNIDQTTTLRAAAFKPGLVPTDVDTQTYIFVSDVVSQSLDGSAPAGWPSSLSTGQVLDYGLDPNVVNDPRYKDTIQDDLRSLPSFSIVMNLDDLFGTQGIYANPGNRGRAWERAASIELIRPDGGDGFQIDAGIRIRGGQSRAVSNPKHAFRLFFRKEYGAAKLNFPLFSDSEVTSFDNIDLRQDQNDSWSFIGDCCGNPNLASYTRDLFARKTQLALGQPATHGDYYHLYVNGQYWGLVNTEERAEADYAASYFGGESQDYDVVKVSWGPFTISTADGDLDAWTDMYNLARANLAIEANYQVLLGNNPDGTRNPALPVFVDQDNLIDFMLLELYAGNLDGPISSFSGGPNNWFAIRNRDGQEGFRFLIHDTEIAFQNVNEDRTGPFAAGNNSVLRSSPQWLWQQLLANENFRLRVSDRVQKHFFNDGALTVDANTARFQGLVDRIDRAIVGESARWGDVRRTPAYNRDDDWLPNVNFLLNTYIPQRGDVFLGQLASDGVLSTAAAPEFNQHGGAVPAGFLLSMFAPSSLISETVLTQGSDVRAFVPTDDTLGQTWTQTVFSDNTWTAGTVGVGYEDAPADYQGLLETVLRPQDVAGCADCTSVYSRIPFTLNSIADIQKLTLRMKYDDGFVAYLNGVEVARRNAPGTAETPPLFNEAATANHPDAQAAQFENFNISTFVNQLVAGENVLAIHGLNRAAESSDLLILPELSVGRTSPISNPAIYFTTDGSDPHLPDGSINSSATLFTTNIPLSATTLVEARVFEGGVWSALTEARFVVNVPLRVSEIMFNPDGSDSTEFIELLNTSDEAIPLVGISFDNTTSGIDFTFDTGEAELGADERIVVVRNQAAFAAAHDITGMRIATGQYDDGGTALSNGGETITLVDAAGGVIQTFTYDDDWYKETDGDGFSLVAIDPLADGSAAQNWRSSALLGGSPATADLIPAAADFNGSGNTDRGDVVQLLRQFGRTVGSHRFRGDFDLDGATSLSDLAATQASLGSIAVAAAPSAEAAAAVVNAVADVAVDTVFREHGDRDPRRHITIRRAADRAVGIRRFDSLAADPSVLQLESSRPATARRLALRARRHSQQRIDGRLSLDLEWVRR